MTDRWTPALSPESGYHSEGASAAFHGETHPLSFNEMLEADAWKINE